MKFLRKSKVNSEATTWGVLSEKVFFEILEISQSLFFNKVEGWRYA